MDEVLKGSRRRKSAPQRCTPPDQLVIFKPNLDKHRVNSYNPCEPPKRPDWEDSLRSLMNIPDKANVKKWLEAKPGHPMNEVILNLIKVNKELEAQVKRRRELGRNKLIRASEIFLHDLSAQQEFLQREKLKLDRKELQDRSMKRVLELENTLNDASSQLKLRAEAIEKLQVQYEEYRAEIAACESRKSESDRALNEVVKREIKSLQKASDRLKRCSELVEQNKEETARE